MAHVVDSNTLDRIFAEVDRGFDQQMEMLSDLVAIPSCRGEESRAQDFMAHAMAELGLAIDRWKINVDEIRHLPGFSPVVVAYDDAINVVGTHRPSSGVGNPRRSLILNGHIDVVPTGPTDMWTAPPFSPVIKAGWLHGRGSGDMKAGLSANLFALRALHAAGFEAAADIYLQSVVEEECTGNGALACLQRGYRAAAALIPEPAAERLNHAQVGVMWFQVRVRGRPVHVAVAGSGSNAIESCFPLVAALHRLEHDWNHRGHEAFKQHHHPLNFVLSRIEGGDWTSSVPAWCTFDMRVGLFPGQNLQEARKEIEQCVHRAALEDGFLRENPPELVYHGFQAEGYVLPPHTPAQACLEQAHRHVRQEPLEQYAGTGTTDARFFGLYQGIPALVYGPRSRDIHGFDEAVEIDSVRRVTKTIASFIAQWCGLQRIKH